MIKIDEDQTTIRLTKGDITTNEYNKLALRCTYYDLTDEEEKKVVDYIKENPDEFEFMDKEEAIAKAVEILYENDEINLYDSATESDFSTDEIKWSEFEDRTAEEILDRL